MFAKIKIKFIVLSMIALFVLLSSVIVSMNVMNYKTVVKEADTILLMMAKNKGTFPVFGEKKTPQFGWKKTPQFISKETPYETRYFSVVLNEMGEVIETDTSRISAVDVETAYEYAVSVMKENRESGFVEDYRYISQQENEFQRITFLDYGRKLYTFRTFMGISIMIGVLGYIGFFIVIVIFSDKILRPVAESYEKQKQFITDAGHEIKTPLAIIRADVDVLLMDFGENEWLEDIQNQTKRLATLTNDLVFLSRMEEEEKNIHMIEFSFSDVVYETVYSFHALARTQNKNLQDEIPPLLSFTGDEKFIRQLVNILMDNALKYSPENGTILVDAQKQGKQIVLNVFNTTLMPVSKDKLEMIFERFYRIDASRSKMTGGYGIGLSVARAIVNAHNGRIYATTDDGSSLKITVCLPL